ncbi:ATP-binding protein [Streptococcus ratti]|uniref:histidine kinase n=1 Tax=Streptococcus ratti FA-1 = DSM 20564 TaxID=699248 RepID=A0ABP2QYZ3_STRRT|nr:HAMP domain-containing sensor histidine kinase [Streptococcus ratti]EJN94309.1 putative histidine kinase SpaK [Streptococcus ratti FA-1 = DSM 20564]EMP70950.1 putative histidine kinase SpaK [Streptococcus ratti FA-1 = DSM 20564]QEY06261.1 HAMP domain-containing histidine kinase [Streptococcus ratti]VEI60602.1 histidine kinase [Streptococcus mutans]
MAVKRPVRSLKLIFGTYFLSIILACSLAAVLVLLAFNMLYNSGLAIPANQTEKILLHQKKQLEKSANFHPQQLPKDSRYILLDKSGKIKKSNMSSKLQAAALRVAKGQEADPSIYGYFMTFERQDGLLVVNYQLVGRYRFSWMNRYLPSAQFLAILIFALINLLIFVLVTFHFARRLQRQLSPIIATTQKIAKQDLDFTVQSSGIKEFNQVLNSLDTMRAALRDSLMRSWQLEQEKQDQITALTHDIKTPLTVIKGNTELLMQTELSENQKTFVGYSLKNIGQVETYLQQLSYLTKNSQLQDFHPEKIKVTAFLEELSQNSQALAATKDIKVQFFNDLSDNQLTAYWDKGLLERALMNIIANAVEHSPKGSQLQLVCHLEDALFQFTCLDSGQGFSRTALEKAKLQFFKDDNSRHNRQHSGLGLTIADNIIRLHGGSLNLSNDAKTAGAKVEVLLPLTKM